MREGWEIKKIGEVCLIKGRIGYRGYTKQDLVSEGEGAITLSPSNIKENKLFFDKCTYISWEKYEESPEIMIFEGDIIYCKTASIGKMALVEYLPEKATLNPQFVVLKQINCYNKFLYYFMNSEGFKGQIKNIIGGTAVPTLSQKNFGKLSLPIPPLSEQQRIVSVLDETFAAIAKAKANAEQNLKNAKELFENYLQSVFENLGKDREEKRLGEIATFRNGMNFSKASRGERIKIVGVKDFQNAFFVPKESLESVTIEGQLNENDVLKEGDILAVRSNGNPELIGRTILAEGISENTSHSGFTIRIRLDFTVVSPFYICHFLKTTRVRRKLIDGGNGINIKSLNQGTLSSLLITFPKSLTKQQTIVQNLNSMVVETNKLEAIYQKKIDDLEELKKSILQKAFSGELKTVEAVAV